MDAHTEKQLKLEIVHIFNSGANEIRVFEMVKNFINKNTYDKEDMRYLSESFDSGFENFEQWLEKYNEPI